MTSTVHFIIWDWRPFPVCLQDLRILAPSLATYVRVCTRTVLSLLFWRLTSPPPSVEMLFMDVFLPGALLVGDALPLEGEDAHHAGVGPAHRAVLTRVVVAVVTRAWNDGGVP